MAIGICDVITDPMGRELKAHGTAQFPVSCYGGSLVEHPVPWHWHDELEAVFVDRGSAVFSIDGARCVLHAGQGIFINAGALHETNSADALCQMHSIVFHPRFVGGSRDSVFWQNYLQPMLSASALRYIPLDGADPWSQEAAEQIEAAWQACVSESPGFEFQVRSALSWLIYLLSSHRPAASAALPERLRRSGERVKVMLQFIQSRYEEELTTAQIAGSALVSESECLRCFRAVLSTTPIQYLRQFRIQKASELLENTNTKISEIGARCGFQEMGYFARTFRAFRGCTPSEYRQFLRSGSPLPEASAHAGGPPPAGD